MAATGTSTPHWEVHPGTGPYLLLVHGFLSSRAQWSLNLEALAQVCRPVVMELYGHGRSPSPEEPEAYTAAGYAEAIDAIRAKLGVEQWFVCGYSLGAALTIRYTLTHPERVVGHVFTNSSSAFADEALSRTWAEGAAHSGNALRSGGKAAIERISVHPSRARRLPPEIYDALVRDAELLDPHGVASALERTMPTASVRAEIPGNPRPALLACGRFERRFAPHREYAAAAMPDLVICDVDAGHAVNMEGAQTFNAAVKDFIHGLV